MPDAIIAIAVCRIFWSWCWNVYLENTNSREPFAAVIYIMGLGPKNMGSFGSQRRNRRMVGRAIPGAGESYAACSLFAIT